MQYVKQILLFVGFIAYIYFGIDIIKKTSLSIYEKTFLIVSVVAAAFYMYLG
jgi:hypothetical protein